MSSESSAGSGARPLFGLVTPAQAMDDEEVFIPMSVRMSSRHGPLSPAYSPYPVQPNDVESQGASGHEASSCAVSERPIMIIADTATDVVATQKKTERKRKQRRQQRLLRRNKSLVVKEGLGGSSVTREGKRVYTTRFDPYYRDRFKSVVDCDAQLRAVCGVYPTIFHNKTICDASHGGSGWTAFCLAAMLGAGRVASLHPDLETVLANCKQLRKFKHDGVVWATADSAQDGYPKYLVRRMGPVKVSNKPWIRPDPGESPDGSPGGSPGGSPVGSPMGSPDGSREGFPFNIEFRCATVGEDTCVEQFDVVVCLHLGRLRESDQLCRLVPALLAKTKPGGFIVADQRLKPALVDTGELSFASNVGNSVVIFLRP